MRKVTTFLAALAACLPAAGGAQQQAPASAAATDPAKMGWMQGTPPPADKLALYEDNSFYAFPRSRWSFAHMREVLPTASVLRGRGPAAPLPLALRPELARLTFVPTGQNKPVNWVEAFDGAYGDAILVLHRGRIVFEKYNGVMHRDQPHILFSVTKSFYGTLAEMLIAEGKLDESKTVAHYLPELAASGFGDATVRQVLDMTTNLDYNEDYADAQAKIWQFAVAVGTLSPPKGYTGPRSSYDYLKTVTKQGEHGLRFAYQSVDTEVLGWLIARISGKRSELVLQERIFSQLGAEHDGYMLIDKVGTPFAAGGLNLTLRDMARFGEMMRLGGRFNGRQIVPGAVVAKIRAGANREHFKAAGYTTMPGWSYKSQWWITHDNHGAYMARGIHGQSIWIDPKAEMVVVRFMSNPVASTTKIDHLSLPAFRALANHLIKTEKPRAKPSTR
jgi:CubicO group peptidase (beta-lactamase class C family)